MLRDHLLIRRAAATFLLFSAAVVGSTDAQEAEPAIAEPNWSFEAGLNHLATSGNSDTSSGGFNALWTREWQPWKLEAEAFFLQAEDDGETKAERYGASLAGARAVTQRLSLTAGWTGLKDRFAGIDFRHVLSAGTLWKLVDTDGWKLDSTLALTWTSEDLAGEIPSNDAFGALAGLHSTWILSENAETFIELLYFPNFDDGNDHRFEGEVGLKASLTTKLAVQLGYQVRYDNQPVPGFEKTDTATTASLVVKLPG